MIGGSYRHQGQLVTRAKGRLVTQIEDARVAKLLIGQVLSQASICTLAPIGCAESHRH